MAGQGLDIRLHVPLLPDAAYLELLQANASRLHSVYASLHLPNIPDARHCSSPLTPSTHAAMLQQAPAPVYLLLNSRFHSKEMYRGEGVDGVVRALEQCLHLVNAKRSATVAGIVYADAMLLTAVARHAPALVSELEATPSINCGLDSWDKMRQHLDLIQRLGFRLPRSIVPDRALNRQPEALAVFRQAQQRELPDAALHLLANEGCLWQCPYRATHEAILALGRLDPAVDCFGIVQETACLRIFWEEPWRILASPFIRPEDAWAVADLVDGLKLSGRSRGPAAMGRVVAAYLAGRYDGNLLELLDTTEALRERVVVPNHALPNDFFTRVRSCHKQCNTCGACSKMAQSIERRPCSPQWHNPCQA